jgi:hypothetical protein
MSDCQSNNISLDTNWTHVGILLDKSGSMQMMNPENTAKQVVDLVREQRGGQITVTAATFSDEYKVIRENVDGTTFNISVMDIQPDGPTALQSSLCRLIDDTGDYLTNMTDKRPGTVVIIVLTDGVENASRGQYAGEPGRQLLAEKIKHQQEKYNWVFYFLGTNIDAINTGKSYGIDYRTCINYHSSQNGCTNVMRSASQALNRVRFAGVGATKDEMLTTAAFTQVERFDSVNVPDTFGVAQTPHLNSLNVPRTYGVTHAMPPNSVNVIGTSGITQAL